MSEGNYVDAFLALLKKEREERIELTRLRAERAELVEALSEVVCVVEDYPDDTKRRLQFGLDKYIALLARIGGK